MPSHGRKRRRLYRWSHKLVHSRQGNLGVAVTSFAESTVIPIPLEALLAPLMLVHRKRVWALALMATLGCLVGAAFGYAFGWLFFETLGAWLLETFGWEEGFLQAQDWMAAYGFWAVFIIGVTPIPFQTAMLLAGVTGMAFPLFMIAAAIARGIRYFGLAAVMFWLAPKRGGWFRSAKGQTPDPVTDP